MSALAPPNKKTVHYPDSDGQPMADNTAFQYGGTFNLITR